MLFLRTSCCHTDLRHTFVKFEISTTQLATTKVCGFYHITYNQKISAEYCSYKFKIVHVLVYKKKSNLHNKSIFLNQLKL